MSAPSHVHRRIGPPAYESPPRRSDPWVADRPGEIVGERQPSGVALGNPGPDQGYAWKLIRRFEDELVLADGERADDVLAGCVGVALRRASLFNRAPVVHDVKVALTVFGFLSEPDPELVEWRRPLFAEVSDPHHYGTARRIADLVPEETLRLPPDQVSAGSAQELGISEGRRDPAGPGR